MLFFIIVAALRPQYGARYEKIERQGNDIYIALDLSSSMLAQDIKPSRLVHAKREILGLIEDLKGDRVGLIAFAGDGIKLAIGKDVTGRIDERADKSYSTQIYYCMDIGATRMEEEKVVEIACQE